MSALLLRLSLLNPRLVPLLAMLSVVLCWASPAWATERLAVLELSGKSVNVEQRGLLTDAVRGAVIEALGGRVQVMTRENMEVMLSDMGVDATCVSEGACEVETARNLGVDYVISGSVVSVEGTYVVSLKLLETRSGQQVASKQVQGTGVLALLAATVEPAKALVATLAGATSTAARQAPGISAPVSAAATAAAMPSSDFDGLKVTGSLTSPTLGKLVCIGPGSFTMGTPTNLVTQHRVTLTQGYCVMEHEVTQGEWVALGNKNPSKFMKCGADCPVEQVSWYDAVAYANAVSGGEGLTPAYAIGGKSVTLLAGATGYRLPTESEWEAAALGRQASLYSGSWDAAAVAWTSNGGWKTHAVCGKQANGYGLCDMSGNVWEWAWDWYGTTYSGAVTDPMGATSGSSRLGCGGDWNDVEGYSAVNSRYRLSPDHASGSLGFRLVRSNP